MGKKSKGAGLKIWHFSGESKKTLLNICGESPNLKYFKKYLLSFVCYKKEHTFNQYCEFPKKNKFAIISGNPNL